MVASAVRGLAHERGAETRRALGVNVTIESPPHASAAASASRGSTRDASTW